MIIDFSMLFYVYLLEKPEPFLKIYMYKKSYTVFLIK